MNSSSSTARRSAATLHRPGGGKTPRGRGGSATRWWYRGDRRVQDLAFVRLTERQIGVREHHERHVA
ncbi:MAG TPA: hypothetical protein VIK25_04270, partial [Gemmatimonadaceae bacterium]